MAASAVVELYRELLEQLDEWFAESSARVRGVVPCRRGCSACCLGPFDISVADALLVKEAFLRLSESDRDAVTARARAQLRSMRAMEPDWNPDEGLNGMEEAAFDRICETLADDPCPLLDPDGACRIYQDRPLVCRMMGLGMITPSGRIIENTCPIAGQFPDYSALPPQPLDLESWEAAERACLEAASMVSFGTPSRADFETTVAIALTR